MSPTPASRDDVAPLAGRYLDLYRELAAFIPEERLLCDPLRTLAHGIDASFYRLVPELVVQARSADEVSRILRAAGRLGVPVTFRAAGTSLSGQAVTDSVLVSIAGAFRGMKVVDGGARIILEPGVIGAEANAALAPYRRKIGPDPASIHACMVGGIAANNSSGMCCGTAQNSYRTVDSMKLILADGERLDTADAASRRRFSASHGALLDEIAAIQGEIRGDPALSGRIAEKYRIKNTTGYGLNAFLDFDDPIDVLLHLMIGSEGTLGFIAEITYRTVEDHLRKASALVLFPDIEQAARATMRLAGGPVAAVELMDRASLRSVEAKPGMPRGLAGLGPDACALLIESRAGDPSALAAQVAAVTERLASVPTLAPIAFTDRKEEFEALWDVRRGLFPAVGAARRVGTTVVIEDVAFPMRHLADGTVALRKLLQAHGYDEAIIFGHALDGNLHFVFTQDFGDAAEVSRYARFMDEVCNMVVRRFDGSLKGEHGTGRNIAPFVELEWGERATALMRRLKRAFDPGSILNPGVILNGDPRAHLRNLKPLPRVHEIIDRCIECGFCEPKCPSRWLTTTPRQRIVIRREIARLAATGEDPQRRARLEADFVYFGDETCATDGLCATACPVSIDTGEYVKVLRSERHGSGAVALAQGAADHFAGITRGMRGGLGALSSVHAVLGTRLMSAVAKALRAASGQRLPLWNPAMPRPVRFRARPAQRGDLRVVYFPSCIARTMGPAHGDPDPRPVFEAMMSLLVKAGAEVRFPEDIERLCCGMPFESKGFPAQAAQKLRELEAALLAASEGGALPVLCDTSPCTYRMKRKLSGSLRLHEPVELIHDLLMDRLRFERRERMVTIHVTCSAAKMGLAEKTGAVARACAETVIVPPRVGCCGFAGDRGFTTPELNASALAALAEALPQECRSGYSTSRTCEIGLTVHGGVPYQSIVHLVDRCTSAPCGKASAGNNAQAEPAGQ